jgi:hypothetical protein
LIGALDTELHLLENLSIGKWPVGGNPNSGYVGELLLSCELIDEKPLSSSATLFFGFVSFLKKSNPFVDASLWLELLLDTSKHLIPLQTVDNDESQLQIEELLFFSNRVL